MKLEESLDHKTLQVIQRLVVFSLLNELEGVDILRHRRGPSLAWGNPHLAFHEDHVVFHTIVCAPPFRL